MLKGSFDPHTGRPYIEGLLVIPALNIDEAISFLVDTGSDITCLMPADGVRFGIDYLALPLHGTQTSAVGLGGGSRPYLIRAIITFVEDDGTMRRYVTELMIQPPKRGLRVLDSLLGRDILDQWSISYCRSENKLECLVISADYTD